MQVQPVVVRPVPLQQVSDSFFRDSSAMVAQRCDSCLRNVNRRRLCALVQLSAAGKLVRLLVRSFSARSLPHFTCAALLTSANLQSALQRLLSKRFGRTYVVCVFAVYSVLAVTFAIYCAYRIASRSNTSKCDRGHRTRGSARCSVKKNEVNGFNATGW